MVWFALCYGDNPILLVRKASMSKMDFPPVSLDSYCDSAIREIDSNRKTNGG